MSEFCQDVGNSSSIYTCIVSELMFYFMQVFYDCNCQNSDRLDKTCSITSIICSCQNSDGLTRVQVANLVSEVCLT